MWLSGPAVRSVPDCGNTIWSGPQCCWPEGPYRVVAESPCVRGLLSEEFIQAQ